MAKYIFIGLRKQKDIILLTFWGDTYSIKEILKKLEYKWDGHMWYKEYKKGLVTFDELVSFVEEELKKILPEIKEYNIDYEQKIVMKALEKLGYSVNPYKCIRDMYFDYLEG